MAFAFPSSPTYQDSIATPSDGSMSEVKARTFERQLGPKRVQRPSVQPKVSPKASRMRPPISAIVPMSVPQMSGAFMSTGASGPVRAPMRVTSTVNSCAAAGPASPTTKLATVSIFRIAPSPIRRLPLAKSSTSNQFANRFGRMLPISSMSTISKVAERAGVSRTTVSHVINHPDRISKSLRERVQAAIDELGYSPNPQAQSLRTGRTNLIAVLIPDILNPVYSELVKVLQAELEKAHLDPADLQHRRAGRALGRARPRVSATDRPQARRRPHRRRLRDPPDARGSAPSRRCPPCSSATCPTAPSTRSRGDDAGGAYAMGKYLAEAGHKRIAHVTGPSFFQPAEVRRSSFERGFADHGVGFDPALRYEGTYLVPSGYEAIDWLLAKGGPLPDRRVLRQFADGARRPRGLPRPQVARARGHRRRDLRRLRTPRLRAPQADAGRP